MGKIRNDDWEEMFQRLRRFKKTHGHCNASAGKSKDLQLRNWIYTQRAAYRNGRISQKRIRRLEKAGVIEGYGVRISATALGPAATVFMQAELDSHRAEDFTRFETAIGDIPEVVECWAVGGGIDYLLKVITADVESYQRLVDRLLSAGIGLRRYYSYVVTKPVKNVPEPPLARAGQG